MANDREQKIRDVYEAMHRVYREELGAVDGITSDMLHRCSRAAVDLLDPVKRIELSGGFYAEPPVSDAPGTRWRVFKSAGGAVTGFVDKEAVEAWEKAGIAAAERHKLAADYNAMCTKSEDQAETIASLRQRIAALGKIIEAISRPQTEKLDTEHRHAR
jgi:hypothetical protein